jgi:hypothetical protein
MPSPTSSRLVRGGVDGGSRERVVYQPVEALTQPSTDRVGPLGAAVALDVDPDDSAVDRLSACHPSPPTAAA